jgi:hypothetical protein
MSGAAQSIISPLLVSCVATNNFLNTFARFACAEPRQQFSVINSFPDLICSLRNAFLLAPKIPNKLFLTTQAGV